MSNETLDQPSDIARMIKIGVCSIIYLAALFIMVGQDNGTFDALGEGIRLALILGSALLVITITILWLKALDLTSNDDEPVAPSTQKSRKVFILSAVFGGAIAILFYVSIMVSGESFDNVTLFSNSPIPPILGLGSAALYVVGMIYACFHWHKSSDEHERAAINAGLYASFYTYTIAAPAWWMAQRSMLIPAQDPMIMYILILTVFSAVWTYKRGA
ncbi:hypothetical protein [Erythrobacter sp. Alg231-14]|uniref:hypothetical protein n=1 Tax=Erythrobacter sp. Alg231-14 TaxID=1922225 RepID=UPI000D550F1E